MCGSDPEWGISVSTVNGAPYSIGELDLDTLTPTFTQERR